MHCVSLPISPFQISRSFERFARATRRIIAIYERWFTLDRYVDSTPPNYPLEESLNNRGNVSSTNKLPSTSRTKQPEERRRHDHWFREENARSQFASSRRSWQVRSDGSRSTCNPFISYTTSKQSYLLTLVVLVLNPSIVFFDVTPPLLFTFSCSFFLSLFPPDDCLHLFLRSYGAMIELRGNWIFVAADDP